jgi:hypothetical protein
MVLGFSTDDLFGKHLVSERSLELFQGVQFQQLGQSLATTFVEQSRQSRIDL